MSAEPEAGRPPPRRRARRPPPHADHHVDDARCPRVPHTALRGNGRIGARVHRESPPSGGPPSRRRRSARGGVRARRRSARRREARSRRTATAGAALRTSKAGCSVRVTSRPASRATRARVEGLLELHARCAVRRPRWRAPTSRLPRPATSSGDAHAVGGAVAFVERSTGTHSRSRATRQPAGHAAGPGEAPGCSSTTISDHEVVGDVDRAARVSGPRPARSARWPEPSARRRQRGGARAARPRARSPRARPRRASSGCRESGSRRWAARVCALAPLGRAQPRGQHQRARAALISRSP